MPSQNQVKPLKIVIALGGNALQKGKSILVEDQIEACKNTAKSISQLARDGHRIGIVHGNGPQIGQIIETISVAHQVDAKYQLFKFDICGAFSQGYIGYHLQNALVEALGENNIKKSVATIITQVEVDEKDPGFANSTKPIGPFYSQEIADEMTSNPDIVMKEDSGRGWRRVVASPKPIKIIESEIIKLLFHSENIVISCGGGGIPVIKNSKGYTGVEAVIDKDFAAAKLAEELEADILLILTNVENVAVNYNKPNQLGLEKVSVEEINNYIAAKEFGEGSMLPKVQASIQFVQSKKGRKAIITSLDKACEAIKGLKGTIIS